MKHLKITSLLLSVVMCVTMAFPSIGVIADEAAEPTETQTEATEKKQETKAPEKKQTTKAPEKKEEPTEPKKEEPTEPKKETPTEPEKKQEPTEPKKEEPTEPKKEEPTEPEKQEPTEPEKEEPTEPEKQEPTEPKKEDPTEPEKQEPTEPEKEEPTEPEKQEPTEPKKEDPTEPEKQEPTEPEKQAPTETETQAPSETDKQTPEETEPEKEPEATEVPGGKVTKSPKNAVANAKISNEGILTWDAVDGAEFYLVIVSGDPCVEQDGKLAHYDENEWVVESDEERKVNLCKVIRNLIKSEALEKTDNNKYYVYVAAYKWDLNEDEQQEITHSFVKIFSYATDAEPIDQGSIKISFSGGKMTWKAYPKTQYYEICIDGEFFKTTATSVNINSEIDKLIVERKLWRDNFNWFQIMLNACDSDDTVLATGFKEYKYVSQAKPKELPALSGVKLENGILTWNSYAGANQYMIRIVAENYSTEFFFYDSPEQVNVKKLIYDSIHNEEGLEECSQYKLELYAVNSKNRSYGFTSETYLSEWSYTFKYKEANTLSVSGKTAKVKKKKVRRKKQTLKVGKVIKFNNRGQGRITYSKISGSKKISINGSNGKVTVKKKTKKGTYKVSVWVKAAGNNTYAPIKKKVTFKIKVK